MQDSDDKPKRQTRAHSKSYSGGTVPRISFAFSGFSPTSSQRDPSSGPHSPMSDTTRSASPIAGPLFPRSNSFTNLSTITRTSLTPSQVYDFAQQCNNSRPSTPVANTPLPSSPVNFTPLPKTYLLPFLDRPSEVKDLLSRPLTSRLFLLLSQTFPVKASPGFDADPSSWSYSQLEHWLTQTGRDEVDDVEWVQRAKQCISAKSELIWERVKAALGVPPELDSLNEPSVKQNGSSPDKPVAEGLVDDEDLSESLGNAWVEPIVASPIATSPIGLSRSPTFPRSPTLSHQGVGRMEDISEDAPASDSQPPPPTTVHGLRVVVSPSESPVRRYSSASMSYNIGSLSQPHVPYDAVAERGPGNPLFPSSFANLALGPTLHAKCVFLPSSYVSLLLTKNVYSNPSLRSPSIPPASAFPPQESILQPRRQLASWAKGWDLQRQEYALSVASDKSRQSVPVE